MSAACPWSNITGPRGPQEERSMATRIGRTVLPLIILIAFAGRANAAAGYSVAIVESGPYHIGQRVTVNWVAPAPGANQFDWIGVFPAGDPPNSSAWNNEYGSFKFTGTGLSGSVTVNLRT